LHGSWIALFVALWAVVLLLTVLVLGLSRRIGALEARIGDSSPVQDILAGAPAVGDSLPVIKGHESLRWAPQSDAAQVVLFLSSTCGPCRTLAAKLEHLAEDGNELPEILKNSEILIITDSSGEPIFGDLGIGARLVTQSDGEISRELGIRASPFGLGIDANGIVQGVTLPSSVQDMVRLAEACKLADPIRAGN